MEKVNSLQNDEVNTVQFLDTSCPVPKSYTVLTSTLII